MSQADAALRLARPAASAQGHLHLTRLSHLALGLTSDVVLGLDHDHRLTFVNDAAQALLRRPRSGLLGTDLWVSLPDLAGSMLHRRYLSAAATGAPVTLEDHLARFDAWFEIRIFPFDEGVIMFWRDVSERRRLQAARDDLARTTAAVLEALPLPTVLIDDTGGIRRTNSAWAARSASVMGGTPEPITNYLDAWRTADDRGTAESGALIEMFTDLISGTVDSMQADVRSLGDGETRWTHVQATRVVGSGEIVVVHHDITERVAQAHAEAARARQDLLTGLANRTQLFEHLSDRLASSDRRPLAVLFLDLDGFKTVNDSLGHDAGDALIRAVAGRLASTVAPGDLLARLGGDEFIVVVDEADADERAEDLRAVLREPFDLAGMRLAMSVSVGIATCGPEHERPQDLLRDADAAMYAAKAAGRDRSRRFSDDMRRDARDQPEV